MRSTLKITLKLRLKNFSGRPCLSVPKDQNILMPTSHCFRKAKPSHRVSFQNIMQYLWKLLKPRYKYTRAATLTATHMKSSSCCSYKYGKNMTEPSFFFCVWLWPKNKRKQPLTFTINKKPEILCQITTNLTILNVKKRTSFLSIAYRFYISWWPLNI